MSAKNRCRASNRAALAVGLIALGLAAGDARAQVPTPKFEHAKPPEDVKKVEWKASASAGLVLTTGNSNTVTFSGGFFGSRFDGRHKLQLSLDGAYAESTVLVADDKNMNKTIDSDLEVSNQQKVTAGNFIGKFRYDIFFTKNNSLYFAVMAGLDKPANKDVFVSGQVGYARQVVKNDHHELSLELGYDFTWVRYAPPPSVNDVFIHSARAFVGYTLTLSENTSIAASTEALINLNDLSIGGRPIAVAEATRVNGRIALTTKIWKALNFRASFTARYDNAPSLKPPLAVPYAAGYKLYNERLDTITEVALVVNFI